VVEAVAAAAPRIDGDERKANMQVNRPGSTNTPNPKILWSAMTLSIFIYLVIAFVANNPKEPIGVDKAIEEPIVLTLYAIGAATFATSFVIGRIFARPMSDASVNAVAPDAPRPLSPGTFRILLVRWALIESVTIFGLVAAFVARCPEIILLPFVLSLAGFVMTYPSSDRIAQWEGGSINQ
jgi:F0F1-type ATP synthase membrane subunit c/vacuolar-type H+-ATPase subunit K